MPDGLPSNPTITDLLNEWAAGRRAALDQVVAAVYHELRRVARQRLHGEQTGHTLDSIGLVHEAYLRLAGMERVELENRAHFIALTSRAMRRVLVDHARRRKAVKRGCGVAAVRLEEIADLADGDATRFLELDVALRRLEQVAAREASVLEQHYFGGLSVEELADAHGTSRSTVKRDLRYARAWLAAELAAWEPSGGPR